MNNLEFYYGLLIFISAIMLIMVPNIKLDFYIAWVILVFVSGMRYYVGTDYSMYRSYFKNINTIGIGSNTQVKMKPLYHQINRIIKKITSDDRIFFFIISFITVTLIFIAIKQQSVNYKLSIFLFITLGYYHYSFNEMRQFISVAVFILSGKYIKDRCFKKYLICILIASSIHTSALILLPLYFFVNKLYSIRVYQIIIAIIPLIYIGYKFVLDNVAIIIFPKYYNNYISSMSRYLSEGAGRTTLVLFCIVIGYCLLNFNSLFNKKDYNVIYFNITVIGLIFSVISLKSFMIGRIGYYFGIYLILFIPGIICEMHKRNKKYQLFLVSLCVSFCLIYFAKVLVNGGVIPYRLNI